MDATRRGWYVTVRAFGGEIITRRLWSEDERCVYIHDEENYRKHSEGIACLCPVGLPREDVLEVSAPTERTPDMVGESEG